MNDCRHRKAEPVELSTGEVVAHVCPDCLKCLPADFDTSRQLCHHGLLTCAICD